MCVGIEYFRDRKASASTSILRSRKLPILLRDSGIPFHPLGRAAAPANHAKWQNWRREAIPAKRAVRVSRTYEWTSGPVMNPGRCASWDHASSNSLATQLGSYVPLKRGELMQGLLTSIRDNQRGICVVTLAARQNRTLIANLMLTRGRRLADPRGLYGLGRSCFRALRQLRLRSGGARCASGLRARSEIT